MKRGTGRTLLIVISISAVAAIIVFAFLFSIFNINSMVSSASNAQSGPQATNETVNYTSDDAGFIAWVNDTNSNITPLLASIQAAGESFDMNDVSSYCAQMQQLTDRYLSEIGQFNLSHGLQNISSDYRSALNDFRSGAKFGESAANGTSMQDVMSSMSSFSQGSELASKVMNEINALHR